MDDLEQAIGVIESLATQAHALTHVLKADTPVMAKVKETTQELARAGATFALALRKKYKSKEGETTFKIVLTFNEEKKGFKWTTEGLNKPEDERRVYAALTQMLEISKNANMMRDTGSIN